MELVQPTQVHVETDGKPPDPCWPFLSVIAKVDFTFQSHDAKLLSVVVSQLDEETEEYTILPVINVITNRTQNITDLDAITIVNRLILAHRSGNGDFAR